MTWFCHRKNKAISFQTQSRYYFFPRISTLSKPHQQGWMHSQQVVTMSGQELFCKWAGAVKGRYILAWHTHGAIANRRKFESRHKMNILSDRVVDKKRWRKRQLFFTKSYRQFMSVRDFRVNIELLWPLRQVKRNKNDNTSNESQIIDSDTYKG